MHKLGFQSDQQDGADFCIYGHNTLINVAIHSGDQRRVRRKPAGGK